MNDADLRTALARTLDELPLWINDLEDAIAVENILLELEDDLRDLDSGDEGFGPKPLDVLLRQVSDAHGLDPEAVQAAVELSDLAASGSYGVLSEDACVHGSERLELLSGCLQSWVEAQ